MRPLGLRSISPHRLVEAVPDVIGEFPICAHSLASSHHHDRTGLAVSPRWAQASHHSQPSALCVSQLFYWTKDVHVTHVLQPRILCCRSQRANEIFILSTQIIHAVVISAPPTRLKGRMHPLKCEFLTDSLTR